MAIIYSYPLVTSIQPSDLLILSVDSSELPTRQVTVGDLLASGAVDVNLNFTADTGTGSVNLSTQSLEVRQGVYITTTATNQELIINHKSTVRQDTNIGDTSPGYGGSFTVIDSVVTDATGSGHVTGVNLKTVTLPAADDTNTTYDLLGYNTGIELVGSDGTRDQIQIIGGGGTTVSQANNIITVSSTSDVSGSGTTNTLTKWTGPTTLGDSIVSESGTTLNVNGDALFTGAIEVYGTTFLSGPITCEDSINMTQNGRITNLEDPQDNQDAATKLYVDSVGTDNYVDGGTYSNSTGTLSLTRTGGLADVDVTGFLEEAPSDGSQYARQNGSWSVVSGGGGGGNVTGAGTTNTLPIWSDGPNSILNNSSISQVLDAGNNVKEINILTTSGQASDFKINGAASKVSLISGISGNDIFLLSGDNTGFYTYNFQMRGNLAVGRSSQATGATLDVGTSTDTIPAAWFRNGVVISNNPSGVQVDNTSMVIGAGNNDNVSGSDHCLIVGSNNQITSNSDQSVAFGQGNAITGSIDAFAVGNSNTLTSSLRTQAIGFNNTIAASSSFVAGGGNSITASSNIFALGDGHTVTTTGSTQDAYLLGTANTITGGTGSFAIGSNLDGDTGNHMVLGYRNNKTSYPVTDYSLGLGNTKFALAVGSTTTTNSNALLITEGGVNRGGGIAQVPRVLLPTVTGFSASNDAAADALGVPQGALYQNQGVVQINRGGGSTTDPLIDSRNYTIDVINSYTVGEKNYLYILTGSSAVTLAMPASPSTGDSIKVVNLTTVTTSKIDRGGSNIMGLAQDMTLDNNKANFELVYTDVTYGWVVIGATASA